MNMQTQCLSDHLLSGCQQWMHVQLQGRPVLPCIECNLRILDCIHGILIDANCEVQDQMSTDQSYYSTYFQSV